MAHSASSQEGLGVRLPFVPGCTYTTRVALMLPSARRHPLADQLSIETVC